MPKISIEEYQRMLNGRLDEIKEQKLQAELVSFSPWHAYKIMTAPIAGPRKRG